MGDMIALQRPLPGRPERHASKGNYPRALYIFLQQDVFGCHILNLAAFHTGLAVLYLNELSHQAQEALHGL